MEAKGGQKRRRRKGHNSSKQAREMPVEELEEMEVEDNVSNQVTNKPLNNNCATHIEGPSVSPIITLKQGVDDQNTGKYILGPDQRLEIGLGKENESEQGPH